MDNATDLAVLSIKKTNFISVCLLTPLSVNCFLIHSHKNLDLKPNESIAFFISYIHVHNLMTHIPPGDDVRHVKIIAMSFISAERHFIQV